MARYYSVITGDIVGSSRMNHEQRKLLLQKLKESFDEISNISKGNIIEAPFEIYRGDSFQGVLNSPSDALKASVLIKLILKKSHEGNLKELWDARIAIGIGGIDFFTSKGAEGDGPAFRNSGPVLDKMKGEHKIAITTPWDDANDEFLVSCSFFDFISSKWSLLQAEVILEQIKGKTQQQIADKLQISQAAVNYRLKNAGWHAVEKFFLRFEQLINLKIDIKK